MIAHGLSDPFRVVAFVDEGQCLRQPKSDTLTSVNTASDLLAVADAAEDDWASTRHLHRPPLGTHHGGLSATGQAI